MGTKLYVGNLNYTTTEDGLRTAFAAQGRTVREVAIPNDRETGRPRGFAFVDMGSEGDARAAIAALARMARPLLRALGSQRMARAEAAMAKVKPSIRPTETYTEPNFLRVYTDEQPESNGQRLAKMEDLS